MAYPLFSQSAEPDKQPDANHGLTQYEWDKVNSRWNWIQSRVDIITNAGDTISGQLISVTPERISIYSGTTFRSAKSLMEKPGR